MKKCNKCGIKKKEEEFHWKIVGIKRQYSCKLCRKQYHRQHYLNNKEKYCEQAVVSKRRIRARLKEYITSYLETHPCVDCGEDNFIVLEFDHVRGKKEFCICEGTSAGYSISRVKKEIAKCEVRCANCHKIRHYNQRSKGA